MTHIQVELAAEAKRAREEGRPFPENLASAARKELDRRQSERAGVGRAHDLDSMIDLIGDMFDEMDAVFRVLSLRAVEDFMASGDGDGLIVALDGLKTDLELHKEALRKIESFIAQP